MVDSFFTKIDVDKNRQKNGMLSKDLHRATLIELS